MCHFAILVLFQQIGELHRILVNLQVSDEIAAMQ